MSFLLYRHADDAVFDNFPKICDHFPNISEDFPKLFQRPDERFQEFSKHFRMFSEDYRRSLKMAKEDPKMFRSYTNKFKQCFSQKIYLEGQSGPWRPFLGANFLGKVPINWKLQKEKCVRVPRKIKQFIKI